MTTQSNIGNALADLIESNVRKLGIKKSKLGEVLGADSSSANQWKYKKYDLFMAQLKKNKVDMSQLEKVATFFGSSVEQMMAYALRIHQSNRDPWEIRAMGMEGGIMRPLRFDPENATDDENP